MLGKAPRSLERMSLTFRDAAASIVDEIATEIPVRFPMATGRWERFPPSVLTWIKLQERELQTEMCEQVSRRMT